MPTFTTETTLPASPAATFAFIVDLTKWPLFTGYGPLPGIVEAFEPGRRYVIRMQLAPPVSYVMAGIHETVELEPADGGTRMRRTFVVTPRSWLTAPIAWFFGGMLLPRAVERHNATAAAGV